MVLEPALAFWSTLLRLLTFSGYPSSSSFSQGMPPDSEALLPFLVSVYEIQKKFLIPNSRFG